MIAARTIHLIGNTSGRGICSPHVPVSRGDIRLDANQTATERIHLAMKSTWTGGDYGKSKGICQACVKRYWTMQAHRKEVL